MKVVSLYRFLDLEEPALFRDRLKAQCDEQGLLGTMLVALTIGPAVRSGHAQVEAVVAAALGVAADAKKGRGRLQPAIRNAGYRRPSP